MLFFLAGLAGVPPELHEAATLDGASAFTRARCITLPLLGPTFAFVLVIAAVNVLVQVDHVIVMTGGGPSGSTNLLLSYIYQQAQQNNGSRSGRGGDRRQRRLPARAGAGQPAGRSSGASTMKAEGWRIGLVLVGAPRGAVGRAVRLDGGREPPPGASRPTSRA